MSDYLTEGWPLGPTSTMYMNGKAVYDIRRYGKPGILASVELRPEKAEWVREAVADRIREAQAEAWDEGYTTGNAHNGRRDANPYRKESGETFADRMARRSLEALHTKYPQGRPE